MALSHRLTIILWLVRDSYALTWADTRLQAANIISDVTMPYRAVL